MKEAAGEANMTVITIILIGIVLAIGTIVIRGVMNNVSDQAKAATEGNYGQVGSGSTGQASSTWGK